MKYWHSRLLVAICLLLQGCGGSTASTSTDAVATFSRYRLIIVQDPTVATRDWLGLGFKHLAAQIPEDSEVVVFTVDSGMIAGTPPSVYKFDFIDNAANESLHHGLVETAFQTAAGEYEDLWDKFHNVRVARQPRSCILTALSQARRYLEEHNQSDKRVTDLVLASDLLEVCDEWGATTNLEQRLMSTSALWIGDSTARFTLRDINHVYVVRALHPLINKPAMLDQVNSIWSKTLQDIGLSAKQFYIGESFSAITLTSPAAQSSQR